MDKVFTEQDTTQITPASYTAYLRPRCTYVELRDKNNNKVFTLCAKDWSDKYVAPLVSDEYEPPTAERLAVMLDELRQANGHPVGAIRQTTEREILITKDKDLLIQSGQDKFIDPGTPVITKDGGDNLWIAIDHQKSDVAKSSVRVDLTEAGFETIAQLVGEKRAQEIADEELYAANAMLVEVETPPFIEQDTDEEQDPERAEKKKKLLSRVLLAIAGWILFS